MKQRRRIYCSTAQRTEIWNRWKAGESMSSIGRRVDRESSSVFSVLRRRAASNLQTGDGRHGRSAWASARTTPGGSASATHCARSLGCWGGRPRRSAARFCATADRNAIARQALNKRPGTGPCVRNAASWLAAPPWRGQYRPSCGGTGRPSRSPAGSSAPGRGAAQSGVARNHLPQPVYPDRGVLKKELLDHLIARRTSRRTRGGGDCRSSR
jgi:hypothetical protein